MDVQQSKIVSYLAGYAGMKATPQFGQLDLRRDLRLEPLDLVLFGLDLERNAESPFPFEALDHVKTVSELLAVVTEWLADEERSSNADDPEGAPWDTTRTARALVTDASRRSSAARVP